MLAYGAEPLLNFDIIIIAFDSHVSKLATYL